MVRNAHHVRVDDELIPIRIYTVFDDVRRINRRNFPINSVKGVLHEAVVLLWNEMSHDCSLFDNTLALKSDDEIDVKCVCSIFVRNDMAFVVAAKQTVDCG